MTPSTPSSASRQVLGVALVVGAIALAVAALPAAAPQRWEGAQEARGKRHAVSTENGDASRAALETLRRGGDAVDAATTAALVLGVVAPTASGIGGGGFAVVWRAKEQQAFVLDFRETAPALLDAEQLGKRPLPAEHRGALVGVPGEVAGLYALHRKYGKRPWMEDVLPAADVAEHGFPLTWHVRRGAKMMEKALRTLSPSLGAKLLAAGGPLPIGARIVRPELAATLRLVAERGPDALHRGPVAEEIVATARTYGGRLTVADMESYAPAERKPLRLSLGRREIITMPPPSAGGLMLAQAIRAHAVLRATRGAGLDADPLGSAPYLHTLAEIMRGAHGDRLRFVGDPDQVPIDLERLAGEAHVALRLAKLDPWITHAPIDLHVQEHGTTHLSIVDAEGNAVALTTTHNTPFGAKIVCPESGILLNDELDDFDRPSDFIVDLPPNAPRPLARPTSSMAPTIVLEDGMPIAVLGGSGGTRIATSVTFVALAHLVFGVRAGDAVGWPRIHTMGKDLLVEPSIAPSIRADLEKRGEHVVVAEAINAVQLVTIDRGTKGFLGIRAAADPRKGGVALAE